MTITKHHLMDISVIINKTAAYILTSGFLAAIYLSLVWLYQTYNGPQTDPPFLAGTIIYGILVGEFFQRIRYFVQTSAEKAFLKGKYDYRKVLSCLSQELARCKTIDDIRCAMDHEFKENMDISKVGLVVMGREQAYPATDSSKENVNMRHIAWRV